MQALAGSRLYVCAAALLLGASAVQSLPELPPTVAVVVAVSFALIGLRLRFLRPLCWFVLALAWTVWRADLVLQQELPKALEGQNLAVVGRVASLVQQDGPHLKFTFESGEVPASGENTLRGMRILLRWYHADEDVRAGERWRLTVRLKRPHGFQNPGGFDYEKWLFRHQVRATGYVRHATRLDRHAGPSRWQAFRERIQRHLRASASPSEGLIRALVIGDRSGVSTGQREALIRTGTLHLLAISGLHIGLVSGFCFVLGALASRALGPGLLWFPAPMAGALTAMMGGGLYALLAGLTIPTQRAFTMVASVMAALLLRRSVDIVRCLAVALIVVLAADPLSVLDPGLWLSFGAVAAILAAARLTRDIEGRLLRLVLVQLLLTLLLAPPVALFFGQVSLVAPLANLFAIPVVGFVVVPLVLLAAAALGLDWMGVAGSLFQAADHVLRFVFGFLEFLAAPGWAAWVGRGHWPILVVAVVWLGVFFVRRRRRNLAVVLSCVLVFMGVHLAVQPQPLAEGEFEMTVLDVGQGLSLVVRTRNRIMLYDTGARFGPRFDAGSAVVVPYLRHLGVDSLDLLVISHGDNDHIGGMDAVRRYTDVSRALTSVPARVSDSEPCLAGQGWVWDGVRFDVISPLEENPPEHNNASCVLRISGEFGSVLVTGDIEREVEAQLVGEQGDRLRSDVLLVPHQGSKTSSTAPFIDRVDPRVAVVAAGYRNRYGHPAPSVVERYRARGVELFDTARAGAVTVRLAEDGIATETYRAARQRFWFGRH